MERLHDLRPITVVLAGCTYHPAAAPAGDDGPVTGPGERSGAAVPPTRGAERQHTARAVDDQITGHAQSWQITPGVRISLPHEWQLEALVGIGLLAASEVWVTSAHRQRRAQLDWIGRLNEVDDQVGTRFVLLADAQSTALEPLMRPLLLPQSEATAKLWQTGRLSAVYLKDVL